MEKYSRRPSRITLNIVIARNQDKSNMRMCVCVFANKCRRKWTGVTYTQARRTLCVVDSLQFNTQACVRRLRRHQITGFNSRLWRLLTLGMWCYTVCLPFCGKWCIHLHRRCRQQVPSKRQQTLTRLHGVTPKKSVQPEILLICIREVPGLNLCRDTDYPDRSSRFSSAPPGECSSGNSSHDWFLPYQFTPIQYSSYDSKMYTLTCWSDP